MDRLNSTIFISFIDFISYKCPFMNFHVYIKTQKAEFFYF